MLIEHQRDDTQAATNESQHSLIQQHLPSPVVFATITGSHAFGMAGDYSDYDVHGCYIQPLKDVIGLQRASQVIEAKTEHPQTGHEVDIHAYDIHHAIFYLLKGNGNFLEDLFSPLIIVTSPLHQELQDLVRKHCLSRMSASHYKGMAFTQQRKMAHNEVKKLLHMYRCLLTGLHLMETGHLEINLRALAEVYQQPQIDEVIALKLSIFGTLKEEERQRHLAHIERLTARLCDVALVSPLPEKPSEEDVAAMEDFLYRVRLEQ